MDGIVRSVSEHPVMAMAVGFAILLIVYFLFKSLIKFVLILIIVAVAVGGYFYFQHPDARPTGFKDAVQKARTGAGKAVEQGKETYEKGKDFADKGERALEKGKKLLEKGKEVLDKGIDKGKAVADRIIGKDQEDDPPEKR